MRIGVKGDRIFAILDEFKTTKEITLDNGRKATILLPEKHSERSRLGTIKVVGPEVKNGWKVGDRIIVSTYGGVRIHLIDKEIDGEKIDEDRFRVFREEEIVAQCLDE